MARKIVILSDGTGNAASSVWRTNVWRIFQSLKLEGHEQVARYDDGVGTSSFKPLAILGGVFGYGLKRNVVESYKFICRNYETDSKLYFFGFSRGAFTVRVLCALVLQQGLVQARSEDDLHDLARKAYRAYRAKGYKSNLRLERAARFVRDAFAWLLDKALGRTSYENAAKVIPPNIEFIGVWDTVAAYGLPADEMTRGMSDWIWPLELPDRVLHKNVLCARQALALDDERTTFHPVLWTEKGEPEKPEDEPYDIKEQRLVQVWFTGMHANVGGGYPDDALAFTPLYWLMREAKARGLTFKEEPDADPDTAKWMKAGRDPDGRLYDSRAGLGGYYRYGPRKVFELSNDTRSKVEVKVPKIHESVFTRMDSGCNSYAPIGLPEKYAIVTDGGTVLPVWPKQAGALKQKYESKAEAESRSVTQDRIWNYVWMRRVVYFLTLGATFHLLGYWLFHVHKPAREFESPIRIVSETLRAAEKTLPGWAHWWIDLYAANPVSFAIGVIILIALLLLGSRLSRKIQDSMRTVWCAHGGATEVAGGSGHRLLHWILTSRAYQSLIRFGKYWLLPSVFALALVVVVATGASHILFNLADSMGAYCAPSGKTIPVNLGIPQQAADFETRSLCAPTGLRVREDFRYQIVIDVSETWSDGEIGTTPLGYGSASRPFMQAWLFRSGILLRRILWRPWFRTIARIGDNGVDEYFLDPVKVRGSWTAYRDDFVARRSGEVFLYVNDAAIGLPWLSRSFYENNHGKAKITLRLCPRDTCS